MSSKPPVLFLSFGGPESPDEIMPFLEHVTKGRGIPRERLLGVAEHYQHMGGRSPINEITRKQVDALEAALGDRRIYLGQRHAKPFIADALAQMKADGVKKAVGFTTAAYRCEASHERYVEAVDQTRGDLEIDYVAPWFDHPLFVDAIAARVREAKLPESAPWIFTAHSIPCAMAKDSSYVEELRACAAAVAEKLGRREWTLAFTSRSGSPRDAWLEPDVSKVIAAHAAKGVKEICLIPFGFVADHVEVLYDLDTEAKTAADKLGVTLRRAQTVGDHPLFIKMIAHVVSQVTSDPKNVSSKRRAPPVDCYCAEAMPDKPCLRAPSSGGRPGR